MRPPLLPAFCAVLALPLSARAAGPPAPPPAPADSVVKVTATLRYPNPFRPWAPSKSAEVAGAGVVIGGNKVLTNAHLVRYATEVHVQAGPGADKVEATVESIGPDVDLAVLRVGDRTFFSTRRPIRRAARLPRARDPVEVYGFPIGGGEMSVTRGTISRLGYRPFYEGHIGLVLQVSAAINPGNSGGPAVVNGQMVGLVVSRLQDAQNIGYVIPNEEIDLFLEDVKTGRYKGKPNDATQTQYQRLENESLRALLKLDKKTRGILAIPPRTPEAGNPFEEFDVITRIGDYDIDNGGMVRLENGLRMPFLGLIPRLAGNLRGPRSSVSLTVIRAGKRLKLALPVTTTASRVIPRLRCGEHPSYFIHGPLVFSPARSEYLDTYLEINPSHRSPLLLRRDDCPRFAGEELVVVTAPMFDHKVSRGYASPAGQVLEQLNRTKVKNLRHLVELLRDSKDEFLTFRFEDGGEVLVFRRTEMARATEEILEDAGIAPGRRGSRDMLEVWNRGATPKAERQRAKDRDR
jgi:S1-C subfamily serine protease